MKPFNKSVDSTSLYKNTEEFNLQFKSRFEVLESISEEDQDVTVVNRKIISTLDEIIN